ncbi:hypothetical protein OIU34_37105 [Pararhizobium sp. BT-229]|uniref:hypothetical protein n=1 Tax=Pararhizobium sp. BT-229 TaxID=2986923 RepID=UPI0021F7B328|nr:hypothetical protein [Pararhizobium sp. BT-229]MCV9967453.1 hypothetical protein [Pararhizobium sp. BT-229]
MEIPVPVNPVGDMQRAVECEELVRPSVITLVRGAVAAGWTADEVLIAVEEVVKDIRNAKPSMNANDVEQF